MGSKKNIRLVVGAPVIVMVCAWFSQYFYYEFSGATIFNPVLSETWLVIVVAILSFIIGSAVTVLGRIRAYPGRDLVTTKGFSRLKWFCFYLVMFIVIKDLAVPYFSGMDVAALRNQAIDEWTAGGIGPRFNAIFVNGLACLLILMISQDYEVRRRLSFMLIMVFFALCIASFSRTLLLIGMAIVLLRVLLLQHSPILLIIKAFVFFVVSFLMLAWLMKDNSTGGGSIVDVLEHHLQIYFFGGVSGLNYYVQHTSPSYDTLLTVPRFIQALSPWDMGVSPSYFDFVETPSTLNVFTSVFPPYHDFGTVGVGIFFFMYGGLTTGATVMFIKTGRFMWQTAAGFFIYAALMTIFDDQFLRGLPVFLILFFVAILFDKFGGKLVKRNTSEDLVVA